MKPDRSTILIFLLTLLYSMLSAGNALAQIDFSGYDTYESDGEIIVVGSEPEIINPANDIVYSVKEFPNFYWMPSTLFTGYEIEIFEGNTKIISQSGNNYCGKNYCSLYISFLFRTPIRKR